MLLSSYLLSSVDIKIQVVLVDYTSQKGGFRGRVYIEFRSKRGVRTPCTPPPLDPALIYATCELSKTYSCCLQSNNHQHNKFYSQDTRQSSYQHKTHSLQRLFQGGQSILEADTLSLPRENCPGGGGGGDKFLGTTVHFLSPTPQVPLMSSLAVVCMNRQLGCMELGLRSTPLQL